jgi:hypothetical protein
MNINALKDLTPEKVKEAEDLAKESTGNSPDRWDNFCWEHQELIVASLQAALAYKRELEQTHGT